MTYLYEYNPFLAGQLSNRPGGPASHRRGAHQENILDLPEDERPVVINDRGCQMKAKPIKRMFEDHHMPQLFARPDPQ